MQFEGTITKRWLSLRFFNRCGHQIVGIESDPYDTVVQEEWIQEKSYTLEQEIKVTEKLSPDEEVVGVNVGLHRKGWPVQF